MTSKCQFIIEIDGVPQTERNYQTRGEAVRAGRELSEYLQKKAKVVEYVRAE